MEKEAFKYSLLSEGEDYAAGYTDMRHCLNLPIDMVGCTIFVCKKGSAVLLVNFKRYELKPGQFLLAFYDSVLVPLIASEDLQLLYFSLSRNVVEETWYSKPSDIFDFLYDNPILSLTKEQRCLLAGWEDQLLWIFLLEASTNRHKLIINAFENLFLAIESVIRNTNLLSAGKPQSATRSSILIYKFMNLIMEHGAENRNVNFYADKLCITPFYLYKVAVKEWRITPKELIDNYVIAEIKILLTTTDLSIKEIAERLHFEDASYLNRFFKRQTGSSLTLYRADHR